MRIVDILYKNIEGSASDIKGNINKVGHLMMLAFDETIESSINGYFEINDHLVINAKQNYKELYAVLKTYADGNNSIANIEGDNIKLGAYAAVMRAQGTAISGKIGGAYPIQVGGGTTLYGYNMRLFIYHGVH